MTPAARLSIVTAVIAGWATAGGCVLPDRVLVLDVLVDDLDVAVRFVEPTPLSPEALEACEDEIGDKQLICQPGEPEFVLPHYLDPTYRDPKSNDALIYNFCSCDRSAGEESKYQLNPFTLYVEDRLDDVDKSPSPLYAAALLDLHLRPESTDPQNSVRYRDYIDPLEPLVLDDQLEYEPSKRPPPLLRALNVGGDSDIGGGTIDLCNRANDTPLKRGYHELRIMVTDRPWYKINPEDVEGQAGVPDLANGATFDTVSYIFRCDDKLEDSHCKDDCAKPMEQQ